jgi:hypothetical protein
MAGTKLGQAFTNWTLKGLTIESHTVYLIDQSRMVRQAIVFKDGYRLVCDTKMYILYEAKNDGTPVRLIRYDEIYDDQRENPYRKYNKGIERLMEYEG